MEEEWFVRVQGTEYGPVDFDELVEWKTEGRLIPKNPVRKDGESAWSTAAEIPGLFEPVAPAAPDPSEPIRRRTFGQILGETVLIYRRGFWQFFALAAMVALPSVGSQLSAAVVGPGQNGTLSGAAVFAGLFNLAALFASIVVWPLYLAGIQIVTREHLEGQSSSLSETLNRAARYWPRVAALCLVVYGAFFLLLVFALGILLMITTEASSPLLILTALALLILQVWMFGRLFASTLFWQQTAVLENAGVAGALRESHELTQSRRDLAWFRRPLWRGALLVSIWTVVAALLSLGPDWSMMTTYFHTIMTTQDPQAIMHAMSAQAANLSLRPIALLLGVVQTLVRPLLGIAFVVLYFDARAAR
ncbi:MAG: DUF4339 domain-containing protein [Verrucomicrobiota bacterium]|nr:DUF4339 domain-containing protein [Verrucomicrobiota bacterium]